MKNEILKRAMRRIAPMALLIVMGAFSSTAALAAEHYGGHGFGFGGGHGGGLGGGHAYSGRGAVEGRSYYGGGGYGGPLAGGGRYYGGRGYYAPRYSGRGFGLGFYAAPGYGYVPPVCNPSGFYDQGGFWHYYPGCGAAPYGY